MFLLCVYYNTGILYTDCVKGLGIFADHKKYFPHYYDYLFSHVINLLGPIRTVTSFSSACVAYQHRQNEN